MVRLCIAIDFFFKDDMHTTRIKTLVLFLHTIDDKLLGFSNFLCPGVIVHHLTRKKINNIFIASLLLYPGCFCRLYDAFSVCCCASTMRLACCLMESDALNILPVTKSVPLTSWPERRGHRASISSKKMTQGAELRPLWNTCLTARSLSPTYCTDEHRDPSVGATTR